MDPSAFAQRISWLLGDLELASPPRRWRTRPPPPELALRRHARLAKKACNRTPAIVATQNVLIRKLGLALGLQMDTMTFENYVKLFQELFAARLPPPEGQAVDVAET
jgi:hypothetical protein